jgi:hypothetical protein
MNSLRDILAAVREGRLDPAEAAKRLDEAETPAQEGAGGSATSPDASTAATPATASRSGSVWADATDDVGSRATATAGAPSATSAASAGSSGEAPTTARTGPSAGALVDERDTTELRIHSMMRRVRIIGDPTVTTVSIDGGHELRREGTVLICESNRQLPFGDQFEFSPMGLDRFRLHLAGKRLSLTDDIAIRVNPAIDIDVEVTAGPVLIDGVGRLRARVTAGSLKVDDVLGPVDLHIVGGTAKIDTRLGPGTHRVRCESGSVALALRAGSDVRVRADAQFGRVVVNNGPTSTPSPAEIVLGNGAGRLDAEVVMGSITMELPQ